MKDGFKNHYGCISFSLYMKENSDFSDNKLLVPSGMELSVFFFLIP